MCIYSVVNFLLCIPLSSQPVRVSAKVKKKNYRKLKEHQRGRVKHQKLRKQRHQLPLRCRGKCRPPYRQPHNNIEPANRETDTSAANKKSANRGRQQGDGGRSTCQGTQRSSSFQARLQQACSPGDNNDEDRDKDGGGDRYPGGRSYRRRQEDLNWILLLLILLVILCFCFPQLEDAPPRITSDEDLCRQHQAASEQLNLHIQDSSSEGSTLAVFRGGMLSKQNRNDGGEESSASSNLFPEGNSTSHLVSEEEGPRLVGPREEMATITKQLPKRRPKVWLSHSAPPASPRPQPYLNPSENGCLSSTSQPKVFTSPSPDVCNQEIHDELVQECACAQDPVENHRIFHSTSAYEVSKLAYSPHPNRGYILTNVDIQKCQQGPPLYYVPESSGVGSSVGSSQEEDEEEDDDDRNSPSLFRGPGTVYKNKPSHRSEAGLTLDSGVGTTSTTSHDQVTTTQNPPLAAAAIRTSWHSSLNSSNLVYLTPSTGESHHSPMQTILSVEEEQTPRSYCQDELVGLKQFNQKESSTIEPTDLLALHQPEPLFEDHEQTSRLLEPAVKVFLYPYPGDEYFVGFQHIPGDLCVFVGGSATCTSRTFTSPIMHSVVTEDTIGRSQQYPLKYFTTAY